jgi:hypothetical protein
MNQDYYRIQPGSVNTLAERKLFEKSDHDARDENIIDFFCYNAEENTIRVVSVNNDYNRARESCEPDVIYETDGEFFMRDDAEETFVDFVHILSRYLQDKSISYSNALDTIGINGL